MNKDKFCFQTYQSRQIYLNSANAEIYLNGNYKSNVAFFFQEPINLGRNIFEIRISVVNAQIPISYYLINSLNYQIIINGTIYSFPYGNYNVNNFMTEWNLLINIIAISFNYTTNKFTFSSSSNFTFSDNNYSIFNIIGFQKNNIYNSSNNSLTSLFCVNFAGITKLNIKSNAFTDLKNVDSFSNSINKTLCSIPCSSNQNGIIFYENFTNYKNIFTNAIISSIDILIMDDFNNFINFNNIDWTITLQIDIYYEQIADYKDINDIYNLESELIN